MQAQQVIKERDRTDKGVVLSSDVRKWTPFDNENWTPV
jgi:hypothetical protein